MKGIASACVLVVIVFELHQGVTASKPKIISAPSWRKIDEDTFLIQEGDELKIVCQGEGRIQFSKQNVPSYIEQSNYTGSFDEASGTYTFLRPSAIAGDTGWYACAEEGIEIKNDEQIIDHPSVNISWIYVYVNSSESFVVMDAFFEIVPILAGSNGVIPCRPTSPNLPVILELNSGEIPAPEDTTYDPKIGFILKAVGREHNGEVYACKLNGTDTDHPNWPMYYTLVEANILPERPTINQDALRHVVWGENITLECTITVKEARLSLSWIAPSSVPKERLVYSDRMSFVESIGAEVGSMETWKTELRVMNVQKSDAGRYTCVAKTVSGQVESSTEIKVWDPSYAYIDLIVEGEKDILLPEHDTARWKIIIETYPKEFEWKWYTESGALIEPTEEGFRDKYSHTQSGIYHIFRISHLTSKDTGEYTLSVSTSKNVTNITLPLTVFNLAESFVIRDPGVITEGDDVSLTCDASLYDYVDNVTWKYEDSGDRGFESDRMNVTKRRTKFSWQSILHIRNVSQSDAGEYRCEAVNNEGHSDRETYLLRVEDARVPEFTYTNMNNSAIFIDPKKDKNGTVTLDCRADGRPIPKITWSKNNELLTESAQSKFSENNTRLQIAYFPDPETASGIYACTAKNRIGEVWRHMEIIIEGKSDSSTLWISLICVVMAIIIVAITYTLIRARQKKVLYKLFDRNYRFIRMSRSEERGEE